MFNFHCPKAVADKFFTEDEIKSEMKANDVDGTYTKGEVCLTVPYGEMWQQVGYLTISATIKDTDDSMYAVGTKDLIEGIDFDISELEKAMREVFEQEKEEER